MYGFCAYRYFCIFQTTCFRLAWFGVSCCCEYIRSYFGLQEPLSVQPAYCAQVTTESMKSGSISPTQSQSAKSNLRYLPFGAVMASKAAVESSARWVRTIPIFRKSGCMIWKVRFVLGTSVGVITAYDILCP